jgi:hypothetical protein
MKIYEHSKLRIGFKTVSKIKAETEYEKYKVIQDQLFESDFDKEIKKMLNKPK